MAYFNGKKVFQVVKVGGEQPTLIEKEITENGEYNAASDNADGYSKIIVNVESGGGKVYLHNFCLTYDNKLVPVSLFSSRAEPYTISELGTMFDGQYIRVNLHNNPASTTSFTDHFHGEGSTMKARFGSLGQTSGWQNYAVTLSNYTVVEMAE